MIQVSPCWPIIFLPPPNHAETSSSQHVAWRSCAEWGGAVFDDGPAGRGIPLPFSRDTKAVPARSLSASRTGEFPRFEQPPRWFGDFGLIGVGLSSYGVRAHSETTNRTLESVRRPRFSADSPHRPFSPIRKQLQSNSNCKKPIHHGAS